VWSGGSKPFEAAYRLFWYVGPESRLPIADFTFSSGNAHYLPAYTTLIALMVLLAFVGRRM
jgi:hypothetical protein